jgi:hypothetical protein
MPALAKSAKVTIKSTGTELANVPIATVVDSELPPGPCILKLESGESIPAVIAGHSGIRIFAVVLPKVPAKGELKGTITPERSTTGVKVTTSENGVELTSDGKPFVTYVGKGGVKPYFFPVVGPTGERFTRAFPMEKIAGEKTDHPHQKSLWFTHGKVNGIDFWSEQKGHGSIVEKTRQVVDGSPVGAAINTANDWLGPDGKLVCSDRRQVRFYSTKDVRIIDFVIDLTASNGPVTFGDTKEGMFGIRVATSMDVDSKKGGKITTSEGLTDAAAWGKPAKWVDYTGPVNGETVGVAILNHPTSFRYPTTWHVRTYGLFAANPFGLHDFGQKKPGDHTLGEGDTMHFGYRVVFHKGATDHAVIEQAFKAFAEPPEVSVSVE